MLQGKSSIHTSTAGGESGRVPRGAAGGEARPGCSLLIDVRFSRSFHRTREAYAAVRRSSPGHEPTGCRPPWFRGAALPGARFSGAGRGAGMASKREDGTALEAGWRSEGGEPGRRSGRGDSSRVRAPSETGERPGRRERARGAWSQTSGPLITLAAVLALEVLFLTERASPDLGAFLVIAVVYSAFLGGVRAGLISAAIMVAYYATRLMLPAEPVVSSVREQLVSVAVVSL